MNKAIASLSNEYLLLISAKYGAQYGLGESLLNQMTKSELDSLFALRTKDDANRLQDLAELMRAQG